jgi:hypothetical protein
MTAPVMDGPDPRKARLYDQLRAQGMDHKSAVAQIEGGGDGGAGWMRGAGIAGRAVVQGLGAANDMMPWNLAGQLAGKITGAPSAGPTGPHIANQLGLPQAESPGERMAVAGGEGAVMGALGGPGAMIAGAAGGLAGQGAQEMGASPLGQMAASMVVGAGLPILGMMGAGVIRQALTGTATRREAAKQSMALLQAGDPNAPVTLGQVAQGGIGRALEGRLRNAPGSGTRLTQTYADQAEGMQGRASAIVDRLVPGGATVEQAGMAVQRGISEGFVGRFKATSRQLYDKVYQQLPTNTTVMPSKTVGVFAEQGNLAASARPFTDNLASPTMTKWADDLATTLEANPKGLPFEAVKAFRSRLGEMLSGSDLVEGVALGDVKRLYGALTDDMTAAIGQSNPQALQAWTRANNFTRAGHDRLERVLQPLIDKNTGDLAFKSMMSGTKEGATALRRTMHSLSKEERKIVSASVLSRMGKATDGLQDDVGGVFSPETYLTKWNKLSAEAKSALFTGADPTGAVTKDLNTLAKAISVRKVAGKTLSNPSGTASNTAFWGILTGVPISLAGVATGSAPLALAGAAPVAGAVGTNLMARAFTNPKIIRWLVKQNTVPLGAITTEAAILKKESEKWPTEDRETAQELSDVLTNMDWPSVLIATANR